MEVAPSSAPSSSQAPGSVAWNSQEKLADRLKRLSAEKERKKVEEEEERKRLEQQAAILLAIEEAEVLAEEEAEENGDEVC